MTDLHPITPPPELVQQWIEKINQELGYLRYNPIEGFSYGATLAAQWGADQELEACCNWLDFYAASSEACDLRATRRPKPPSLKEQALEALEVEDDSMPLKSLERTVRFDLIRRALEQLND